MIACPTCQTENPNWAIFCRSCQHQIQASSTCINCGFLVLQAAHFCGQCGTALRPGSVEDYDQKPHHPHPTLNPSGLDGAASDLPTPTVPPPPPPTPPPPMPVIPPPEPLVQEMTDPSMEALPNLPEVDDSPQDILAANVAADPRAGGDLGEEVGHDPGQDTNVQCLQRHLVHVTSHQSFPLATDRQDSWYLGKPNDRQPPDLDFSKLPHGDVVSRIHARITLLDHDYLLEDLGSANGTYVNQQKLVPGDTWKLAVGDTIVLGKGNLVSFIFDVLEDDE